MRVLRPGATALLAVMAIGATAPAIACDICAVYTGFEVQATEAGLRLGVAEQFTRFGTLQENGEDVSNPEGEYLNSSITQLLFGYQFNRRFGARLVVPIIRRGFQRAEPGGPEKGVVSGAGDLSLIANVLAYEYTSEETVALVSLFGGLQLPSGDSELLGEEAGEDEVPVDDPGFPFDPRDRLENFGGFTGKHSGHGSVPSGIHGHDLALGTGAVDGIIGASAFASWRRFFGTAQLQYTMTTEGAFDYEYANELIAAAGPGGFVLLHDDYTLGLKALLTVETKGGDTMAGQPVEGTSFTGFYAGPAFHFTWSTHLTLDLAADLPAIQNAGGLQIVPDWRIRAGAVWRF